MSKVHFIGCLHLGHESVAKWRGFKDSEEHDNYLISQWNKTVRKKDIVYILGDVTMETDKHYYKLDQLNGRKKVVLGNHDLGKHVPELLKYVESVAGMVDYKGLILTHCPIHPNEIGFCRASVHAHIHHKSKLEECVVGSRYQDEDSVPSKTLHKYVCVDALLLDFKPMSTEQVLEKIKS